MLKIIGHVFDLLVSQNRRPRRHQGGLVHRSAALLDGADHLISQERRHANSIAVIPRLDRKTNGVDALAVALHAVALCTIRVVEVGDTHNYWYAIFTSFTDPVDRETMRAQRLEAVTLPDYIPKSGRHNNWGFNAEEQMSRTYLGMGESDINVHDQWAQRK